MPLFLWQYPEHKQFISIDEQSRSLWHPKVWTVLWEQSNSVTYLKENTTYRKSITITTQSGWWTQVYRRTITSPHRVILYIDIISVLNGVLCHMTMTGKTATHRLWFSWAVKNQWILHSIWILLLAMTMESILPTLQFLIPRGINMLQLVQ